MGRSYVCGVIMSGWVYGGLTRAGLGTCAEPCVFATGPEPPCIRVHSQLGLEIGHLVGALGQPHRGAGGGGGVGGGEDRHLKGRGVEK